MNGLGLSVCSTFEAELAEVVPVVKSSIAGTRIVGRMCVGESLFYKKTSFCALLLRV